MAMSWIPSSDNPTLSSLWETRMTLEQPTRHFDNPAIIERDFRGGVMCDSLVSINAIGLAYKMTGAEKALAMTMNHPNCGLANVYFQGQISYLGGYYTHKGKTLQVVGVKVNGYRGLIYCFIEVQLMST